MRIIARNTNNNKKKKANKEVEKSSRCGCVGYRAPVSSCHTNHKQQITMRTRRTDRGEPHDFYFPLSRPTRNTISRFFQKTSFEFFRVLSERNRFPATSMTMKRRRRDEYVYWFPSKHLGLYCYETGVRVASLESRKNIGRRGLKPLNAARVSVDAFSGADV